MKRSPRLERILQLFENHPVVTLVVWGIVLMLPMLIIGASLTAHDSFHHMEGIQSFAEQIGSGELYPRWIENANAGLGSPTFFFYFPLPYYVATLFAWLGPVDPYGVYRFAAASTLMLILSGVTMRAWLSGRFSRRAALIGGLIYMAIPFHLVVDLYIRMAFSQFSAAIFLPLILYGIDLLQRRTRFAPIVVAVATAGMLTSHLPTSMLFAPLPFLYTLFIGERNDRLRLIGATAGSMALGAALVGVYLIPFVQLRPLINLGITTTGKLNYSHNFLLTPRLILSEYNSYLGYLILSWSALSMMWIFLRHRLSAEQENMRRVLIFSSTVVAGSLFMMSSLSTPVWYALPMLQGVQFAQRFFPLLSVALTPLLLMTFILWRRDRRSGTPGPNRFATIAIPSMLLVAIVLSGIFSVKYVVGFYRDAHEHRAMPTTKYQFDVAMHPPEYLTIWATRLRPANPDTVDAFMREVYTAGNRWRPVVGSGEITGYTSSPRAIRFVSRSDKPFTVDLHRFYFAGLVGAVDSGEVIVSPSPGYGLVRVTLPAGERKVSLRLGATAAERNGWICSLLALVALIVIGIVNVLRTKRRR